MTPKQIKRRLATLVARKTKIYEEVAKLQSECPHEGLTGENHGDTGNWSASDDHYWTVYVCPTCEKRWQEDQDESWYDRENKTHRTKEGYAYTAIRK